MRSITGNITIKKMFLKISGSNNTITNTSYFMRKISTFLFALTFFTVAKLQAQFNTPTVNGTIAASEYGIHTDGSNQQSSGTTITYMTWNATNLFIGVSAANTAEGFVIYFDKDNATPIDGGTNASGTNVGNPYDGTNFAQLPFRADIVLYVKNGYREFRTFNSSNGWTAATVSFGTYAETLGTEREFSIPWASFPGGKPAAFNWFSYVTSGGGFVYGQVPTANGSGAIGTTARYERYYNLTNTNDVASTKPMSRDCYVFNSAASQNSFGAISVFDFTMNTAGLQIARTTGTWTIGGTLRVNAGTVFYGSGGLYGPSTVADMAITGGTLNLDLNNQTQSVTNSITVSGGTLQLSDAANVLTLGATGGENKVFTLSGGTLQLNNGTLNVNGRVGMTSGTFNMPAGNFNIDPNSGSAGTSIAATTDVFGIGSVAGTVNGGTILINDPLFAGTTGRALAFNGSTNRIWSGNTVQFGGATGNASTSTNGFVVDTYMSFARLLLGNVIVNGGAVAGSNRFVCASTSTSNGCDIGGNLTINANSEARDLTTGSGILIGGNIVNNGTLTIQSTGTDEGLRFATLAGGFNETAVTAPRTVSGSGIFRNSTTSPTANFSRLYINNTASGAAVTFGIGNVSVSSNAWFESGVVDIGNNNSFNFVSSASTATRTSGYVLIQGTGQMNKDFATGSSSFVFHTGENAGTTEYSPFSLNFSANSVTRTIGVRPMDAIHPNIDDVDVQTNYISRYWQLSNSAAGTYTYTGTATYLPADINGTQTLMKMNLWNGVSPWKQAISTAASNLLTITTGLTETTGPLSATAEFTGRVRAGITYTWNQTGTAAYGTAANWTPTRTLPATDDILVFDGATTPTPTVTGVTTETIGKLLFTNSANVIFQSAASVTLTISGGTGTDFDIPGGSTLQLASTAANSINIAYTGAQTASIAGTLSLLSNTSNNNTYTATNSTTTVTGTINSSGTITSTTANLLFTTGIYNHTFSAAGVSANLPAIPTATWTANTSLCTVTGLTNPTAGTFPSGLITQTFGNFTWNTPLLSTDPNIGGGTITSVGTFTMTSTGSATLRLGTGTSGTIVCTNYVQNGGTINTAAGAGSGTIRCSGTFNQSSGTIDESSTGSGNIEFNGSSSQSVTVAGTVSNTINYRLNNSAGVVLSGSIIINANAGLRISAGALTGGTVTYSATGTTLTYDATAATQTTTSVELPGTNGPVNLTVNNTNGTPNVSLHASRTITGILTLTAGRIILGSNDLTLANGGTLTVSLPGATKMIVTDGSGLFRRGIPASSGTYLFPIGETTGTTQYSPVTLQFNANSAVRIIGAKVIDAVSANMNTGSTPTNYLSRYWTFSENGAGGTYNYYINPALAITGVEDEVGTASSIKASYWNGSAWTLSVTSYSSGALISGSGGVSETAAPLGTVEWTGRDQAAIAYTWIGFTDGDWNTASNWSPSGIPGATDNVTLANGSAGIQANLNLTSAVQVNDITFSGSGTFFSVTATGAITAFGNVTHTGGAATWNAASTFTISSSSSQTVPGFSYGNLNLTGGNRVWPSSVTVGIAGTFTAGAGTYTASSNNTVDFTGSGAQTIPAVNYYNLSNSGNGARILANGTIRIANSYSPTTAAVTVGTSTIDFNGAGAQTIPGSSYYNITNTGNGNRTLANGGTITLNGTTFTPGSGIYTVTGNTWVYANTIGATLGTFTYNNLQFTGSGSVWDIASGSTVTAQGSFTQNNGSSGAFIVSNSSSGTSTLNITGTMNVSAGTFIVAFWNGTGSLTVGGLTTINNATFDVLNWSTAPSHTVNFNGGLTISGTGILNLELAGSGSATVNVVGDFTATSTDLAMVDFGSGTVTGNAINISGNFIKSGTGEFSTASGGAATGFVFNKNGTQTFSYSGTNSDYTNYTINSSSTLQLQTGLTISGLSGPSSSFTVNGTLDAGIFTIGGGATNGSFILASGATLKTSNTNGIVSTTIGSISTTINTRTFNAAANYEFYGSAAITGTNFGNTAMNNLTMSNTTGVTVNGAATVNGIYLVSLGTVNVSTGATTLGGSATMTINSTASFKVTSPGSANFATRSVTIKSTSAGTGTIGTCTGAITNATNVTMERWIPQRGGSPTGGRAYRLLAPTVNTTSTIRANWMEGGLVASIGGTSNPVPNYGTHITGTGGNANNFDVTQNNAASLYFSSNGTIGSLTYTPLGSTTTGTGIATMNALTGYFLYIRGDRSVSLQIPLGTNMPTTSTTLRTTGTLITGPVTSFTNAYTGGGAHNLVTNPYPSPIDWALVKGASSNITPYYTFWDPNVGSRGGFVTVHTDGTVGGGGTATKNIQTGQAFFVESDGVGTPLVSIQEGHKTAGNNNTVFIVPPESFQASLYFIEDSGYRRIADGVNVRYDDVYSALVDVNDAKEMENWDENIAINREAKRLAIESRPVILVRDTIPLFISNMKQRSYEFEFIPSSFTNIGLKAELIDKFLNTRTLLSVVDTVRVNFTVTTDAASKAADRFMVVFGTQRPLAVDAITIKANQKNNGVQVEWVSKTETDMVSYEVERSVFGTNFVKVNTTAAIGNSSTPVGYNWFDANPNMGSNFYRVKAIDKAGNTKYSDIVRVVFGKGEPGIVVYPNPVEGRTFKMDMNNLAKGTYLLNLYNNMGQLVYTEQLQHDGSQATKTINLKSDITKGAYQLQLASDNGFKTTQIIIKN